MNPFIRWMKFNLVGVIGMAVQLAALAGFNRLMTGHYLYASAVAIEFTLLHNFVWHLHYTWRDRRGDATPLRQFVRFHLSNGLVSMLGNLVLMRLLMHQTHLPLLVPNAIAILCCSIANFFLGNNWAFTAQHTPEPASDPKSPPTVSGCSVVLALMLLVLSANTSHAQVQPGAAAPAAATQEFGTDCAYENVFAGPAVATGDDATKATFTAGITIGQYFAKPLGKGLTGSPQFELGIVGPLPHGHPLDGLASVDYMFASQVPRRDLYPFLTAGYTRIFDTGNAVNFGLGLDFGAKNSNTLIRIELRDYYLFTGPRQHVMGLRIGLGGFIAD